MTLPSRPLLLLLPVLTLCAADQAWKTKPLPEWTEQDANDVMTESPWSKANIPTFDKTAAIETQIPGSGGYGMKGMNAKHGRQPAAKSATPTTLPKLMIRWESAQPLQAAELKAHRVNSPAVDDEHYAIAVYGIPRSALGSDSKQRAEVLKRLSVLKFFVKKEIKPSNVEIEVGESEALIVYYFPKTNPIDWRDHQITFEAQIGSYKISQVFNTDDMTFRGQLEL